MPLVWKATDYYNHIFKLLSICFPSGNHTIAIAQALENYETIKDSFKEVFTEINQVQADGCIIINGEKIAVDLYLGGDYKVSNFK